MTVVEDLKLVSHPGLKKPIDPILPVTGKFEEKLPLMAPVGNVPDMTWKKVAIGSWHWQ